MICENMIRKLEQLDAFAARLYIFFSRMLRICALRFVERAASISDCHSDNGIVDMQYLRAAATIMESSMLGMAESTSIILH